MPGLLEGKTALMLGVAKAALGAVTGYLASDLGRGGTGNILFVDSGFQIMGL